MDKETYSLDFFLGSNSDHGFVSHFSQLQNPSADIHPFLIKGGPGTGKSGLMKKFAASAKEPVEYIHCSSDPDSLDGLFLNHSHVCFVDSTPPHTLEPKYPAAFEHTVNLLEAIDENKMIKNKDAIVSISGIISGYHNKFCQLLKCANVLFEENRKIISPSVNIQKLISAAKKIAKKEFHSLKDGVCEEKIRMTSAFTPQGLIVYENTVETLCQTLYLIHDEYRVCAPIFMESLRRELSKKQVSYYLCYSPFHPDKEIDQILIPQLKLGFVTTNKYLPLQEHLSGKVINATRFIEKDIFKTQKQRLSFYRKTARELLNEGIENLRKAKESHDILESYYIPCMNFKKVDEIYLKTRKRMESLYTDPFSEES